jgi:hypothetical protein
MPTVQCKYTVYGSYSLPKSVKLLSVEENKKVGDEDKPFSWYIKWDTLHYFDAEGKKHTVIGRESDCDDWKHPNENSEVIEEDEEEEDADN